MVAGDTANGLEGLKFLDKLRKQGRTVLATDGNHESYANYTQDRTVTETSTRFREKNTSDTMIDGIRFILRNGWYIVEHEALWQGYMNDSKCCLLSAEEVNHLAREDARYIRQALREAQDYQQRVVVVTHTAPCLDTLNPAYEGHYSNDWYYNRLMTPMLKEFASVILVWCHGHTHAPADKIVHGVRVVCNPRGYPGENPNWKPQTIEATI